jgi:hypothetical protein
LKWSRCGKKPSISDMMLLAQQIKEDSIPVAVQTWLAAEKLRGPARRQTCSCGMYGCTASPPSPTERTTLDADAIATCKQLSTGAVVALLQDALAQVGR